MADCNLGRLIGTKQRNARLSPGYRDSAGARWLVDRLQAWVHEAVLDGGALVGGTTLTLRGLGVI